MCRAPLDAPLRFHHPRDRCADQPTRSPSRFGKQGRTHTARPLLHHQPAAGGNPERLIIQYARRSFTGYWGLPRSAGIPPITEAQAEALDALHFAAEKHAASLDFRKGDIQYVNNLSIFHARGGFEDSESQQYASPPLFSYCFFFSSFFFPFSYYFLSGIFLISPFYTVLLFVTR